MTAVPGIFELIDNDEYGRHRDALRWLATHYAGPLNVATGYVGLDGLDALVQAANEQSQPVRLLIGAAPGEGALTGTPAPSAVRDRFRQSVDALRRERDFSGFPASRRAVLERVSAFISSDDAEVRRYVLRFLHGKTYVYGSLDGGGALSGPGAALVTSANLTAGGLTTNLELGMVQYQPNVVAMALAWHRRLWDEADDFKDQLLDLLRPPPLSASPEDVFLRALIERYGDEPVSDEGSDRLTAFQRDGAERARAIMDRYGGVLYADGVGMGKTEIGIDLIREHVVGHGHHALVVASAQLRNNMWRPRLEQERLPAAVVSYQELAQDQQLGGDRRVLNVPMDAYRLVIVDEAHAYRNTDTTWYAALSRLMGGPDKKLALLTATPVNNTLWDLQSLFLLFGRHDAAFAGDPLGIPSLQQFFREAGASQPGQKTAPDPSPARLFPLLDALTVRRDRAFIREHYEGERFPGTGLEVRFPEPQLRERRYDLDKAYQGMAGAIAARLQPADAEKNVPAGALTMAQYRPESYRIEPGSEAARQEALASLMRSLLLKRFESCWYAALQTVRRMRRKAAGRIRYLEAAGGGEPLPGDEDDLGEIDAAATELMEEPGDWADPEGFRPDLLVDLQRDVDTLDELMGQIAALEGQADPKLEALRDVMATTDAQKVVIFTSFRDTAEYLQRAFEADPELLRGREWAAVVGAETSEAARESAIDRLCPDLAVVPGVAAKAHGEIDVLLSTDVLSEGQNLQQAQAVLSYDMPWNPQRVVQRNGRVIRLRSPHTTAFLYTLMPDDDELDQLLGLEARLQAKISAANASMGMETPVLATEESEQRIYEGMRDYADRLADGDVTLLDEDEGPGGAAFAGEHYRAIYRRAVREGEADRVRALPWGIGAAIARTSAGLDEPAVFFACRTRDDRRYWRMVSASGAIVQRDDLPMLRLIDPAGRQSRPIPADLDLEALFAVTAADICEARNQPPSRPNPPASQRWALNDILSAPDAPAGDAYNAAADVLSVPQGALVRRALSELRREYGEGGMSLPECANRIRDIVAQFRLRPVELPAAPSPITPDDLGVVCYQVVLPAGGADA